VSEFTEAFFKRRLGKSRQDWKRRPTLADAKEGFQKKLLSDYPPILLGYSSEGPVHLLEEERTHFHIVGSPGEGKSKFLELLIRHDVDRLARDPKAPGVCLIDSGDYGATYKAILRYCRHIGFDRICVIDPHDFFDLDIHKLPTINPFGHLKDVGPADGPSKIRYDKVKAATTDNLLNSFRVLWDDELRTITNVNRNLGSVLDVLYNGTFALSDALWFADHSRDDAGMHARRNVILSTSHPLDAARRNLQGLFGKIPASTFDFRFGSTIGRIDPMRARPLNLILGSTASPVNFEKLIAEGWLILCNLDPSNVWGVLQQQLLGTLIISEVIAAIYDLNRRDRDIPYYIYIDEVGRYATKTLAEVIHYRRKSNIRLLMAHQQFSQIRDDEVMAGLKSARNKVLFYCGREDMEQMIRQMYYGDMEKQAYSALNALAKQNAVIKLGKTPPRQTKLADVPDVPADRKADKAFLLKLYQQPWYRTEKEINDEINARFDRSKFADAGGDLDPQGDHPKGRGKRKVHHARSGGQSSARKRISKTAFD
jgi:hypothetical protein